MTVHWQESLLQSLEARDAREKAYLPFIQQYQRLAQSTATLKERNDVLLSAAKSSSRGTVKGKEASSGTGDDNPVRAAYVTSLESQIASLKEELAGLYRTQSQNAQRLLALSDSLRDTEDRARDEADQRKSLRLDMDRTQRRCQDLEASLKEKEKMIVHLTDELQTNGLEFNQLEERNKKLVKDNKNLLQRWLDRMNQEATQVNEANAFIESTRKSKDESRPARSRNPSPTRSAGTGGGRRTPTASTKSSASKRPSDLSNSRAAAGSPASRLPS